MTTDTITSTENNKRRLEELAPEPVSSILSPLLKSGESPFYVQMACADKKYRPSVRTVQLKLLPERKTLGFACSADSPKAAALRENPLASFCWFHPRKGVQLRWQATAAFLSDNDPDRAFLWKGTDSWLKKEYGSEKSFLAAALDVSFWDLYAFNLERPEDNNRRAFLREPKGVWKEEKRGILC